MRNKVAMFFLWLAGKFDPDSTQCGDIRGAVCNLGAGHRGKHTDGNLYWDENGAYFIVEDDDGF